MERITGSELAHRLRLPEGLAASDPLTDPLLVVDLAGAGDVPAGAVDAALRGRPVVAAAVGASRADERLARAFDLVVADDASLETLACAVAAHPIAAVSLTVLLRSSEDRGLTDGLAAESATYSLLQAGEDHRRWLAGRDQRPTYPAPSRPCVNARRIDDTLRLTLDRPEVHNALSAQMRDELLEALAVASLDRDVAVVLDGAGPSFCSGGDLNEFGTRPDPATAHVIRLARSLGRAIASVADRMTVRVHGTCVGAGVELPAFAGRVVADPRTRFWLPEIAMGLLPGAGGTVSITRRIGRQRLAHLALTGATIDAPTAAAWGLVDAVEPVADHDAAGGTQGT